MMIVVGVVAAAVEEPSGQRIVSIEHESEWRRPMRATLFVGRDRQLQFEQGRGEETVPIPLFVVVAADHYCASPFLF